MPPNDIKNDSAKRAESAPNTSRTTRHTHRRSHSSPEVEFNTTHITADSKWVDRAATEVAQEVEQAGPFSRRASLSNLDTTDYRTKIEQERELKPSHSETSLDR